MRIISGKYKSRKIKYPKIESTRPTTDKVRESLFNIIGPYFEGGLCLDLFAGSGSNGFEALSRGIDKVFFVDTNFEAIKILKENSKMLKTENDVKIIKSDFKEALKSMKNIKFDLVFLDPPYMKTDFYINSIELLTKNGMLNKNALIIVESNQELELKTKLDIVKVSNYGKTKITIYEGE